MISSSLRIKLAGPAALALLAAVTVGIVTSPAMAAKAPGLSATTPQTVTDAATQKPVQVAQSTKKKKKKKKKRRGSYFN
ncbi:MAG: hypothetical protein AAGF81_07545 [Pseudomonadota bacterium]